jgi:acyl carrier protein
MYLNKVKEIVSKELKVDINKVGLDTHFLNDLGADSLDAVELMMAVEDAFDVVIPDEDAQNFNTVRDVVAFLENNK